MNVLKHLWTSRVSLKEVFSIDLRSLAMLRIGIALVILLDLILRSRDMIAFYTDDGVLPRKSWAQTTHDWYFSIHAASGELWWQIALFLIAAVFALMLLVGYRTRLATVASWLLLASLLNRTVFILQGGDILLVVISFWAMFLPIGARWSVDAALQPEYRNQHNHHRFNANAPQLYFSVATVAIILQTLYLYFFTALLKSGDAWRYPFEAAHYTISIQHFATPLGVWFGSLEPLLPFGAFYVIFVEYVGPLLILLPFAWPYLRIVGLLMLTSLHVAFMLLLHIGLFPLMDYASLTVLIPASVWVWLAARKRKNLPEGELSDREKIIMHYDEDCGFCLKMCLIIREFLLPDAVKIIPAQSQPAIYAIMERENSWVITDHTGRTYLHWHAMQFLFAQSLLFKPIAWLMKLPPLMAVGNRVYHKVATNRGTMGDITARFLPFRKMSLKPSVLGQLLAAAFLIMVTLFNISTLPGMLKYRDRTMDYLMHMTRIDQKWSMFAPVPLKVSFFPQIEGTLRNGEKVNLYELTEPNADWEPPAYMYPLYDGYRWRKYLDRFQGNISNTVRGAYGNSLCNAWNRRDIDREEQLGILHIHYVYLRTNTTGEPKQRTRKSIWQHWCFPEFKPK